MKLNRTGSIWNRNNRNRINLNWDTLEDFISQFTGNELIEWSYNLLNPDAMIPGTLNTAGNVVDSLNSSVTEYISFPPNAPFNVKPTGKITQFYDMDYNLLASHSASENPPHISPPRTAYVRMAILNSRIEETWAYQGYDDKPYKEYGFKPSEKIYDADFIKEVKTQIEIAKKLAENQLQIPEYTQLFNKNTVTDGYIVGQTSGELIETPGFYASEFKRVIPGSQIMMLPTVGQSAFYDIDYQYVSGFNATQTNPITVPDNAYYLRTSGHNSSLDTKMIYIGNKEIPYQSYGETQELGALTSNRLTFNADGLPEIKTPYDEVSNIDYTFGQLGINEIYHLRRAKTDYWNQLYSSDYISPYRIKAVNNPIADNPVFVTGGNHGSDGNAGGYATAKPVSIDAYIDNKKITSGTHNTNSPIVVKVVNDVCAYNTINRDTGQRRDVLRETITYTFYANVYTVSIDMQALEAIEFERHRGIAFQRHNHNSQAYVPTDSTGIINADGARDFKSTAEGSTGNRLVHISSNGHLAVLFIDERIGLGDFELNDNDPRWFMSAGKSYSNTIEQGKNYAVSTGDSIVLSGGYYFGKGLTVPGMARAYSIVRGGKRVYCVDDFYSRNGYVEVLPEDINKEVKIIKNVGYTAGSFTTSKGLKISKSSGAGTLMFEVV